MSLFHARCLTLEKDGTTMDCAVFGTGKRALLLIPGLSFQRVKGAELPLAWQYRIFSKEYTVYVLDKKNRVPEDCTIGALAEDAAFAMDQLGLSRADVFGVSQGGMIAQELAIRRPELVNKLVLAVTAARPNPVMEKAVGGWIEMARRQDYQAIVGDMLKKLYSAAYVKKYGRLFPLLSKIGKPGDLSRFIALARACLTCDSYSRLDQIACPVFVIGGRQDLIVTGEASEEMAAALGCPLYLYGELGHSAYTEAPDFNRRVFQFLTE